MYQIGFIGMGNMASALMIGFIKSGALNAWDICGYDISENARDNANKLGVQVLTNNDEVIQKSQYIFVAIKPQVLENVIVPLKNVLKKKAVISIALGYDYDKYALLLDESTRHLTIMPNTPARVCEGMTLLEEKHSLTPEEYAYVRDLLSHIGSIEVLPSALMNAGGAVSGCGPAFIYMIIEAMADGAVKNGLPREKAYHIVSQVIIGSGSMQKETQLHPGILKDQVTSPAGSTIRGVKALEDAGVRAAFIEAIDKSC